MRRGLFVSFSTVTTSGRPVSEESAATRAAISSRICYSPTAVCRALVTRPALVLADEPTGNLDSASGDEVARALVAYARTERALVIIATHNHVLAEACDRTLVLENGRLSQG